MENNFETIELDKEEIQELPIEIEEIDEKYCVYKHSNLENGKVYYGIAQNYLARWNNGKSYSQNAEFWSDIILYGWKNFKHEIIFKDLTKDQAMILEGLLIQETESYLSENGYNQNFRNIDFEEIYTECESEENVIFRVKRRGRNGRPLVYEDKYYPNIKSFSEFIGEDMMLISQGLNPNCARKLPKYLIDGGLRYATDEEIEKESE